MYICICIYMAISLLFCAPIMTPEQSVIIRSWNRPRPYRSARATSFAATRRPRPR